MPAPAPAGPKPPAQKQAGNKAQAREPAKRKPPPKKQAERKVPAPEAAKQKPPTQKSAENKMPAREAAERQRTPPPVRPAQTPSLEALTAVTEALTLEEALFPVCWSKGKARRSGSRVSGDGPESVRLVPDEVLGKLEACDLDRLVPHTRK